MLIEQLNLSRDEDGTFIVSDAFSAVYGAAMTVPDAVIEYGEQLRVHRDYLERNHARLAPGLVEELRVLRRVMDGQEGRA